AATRQTISQRLGRQSDDLWGLVLVVSGALLALGYFNLAGPVGRVAESGLQLLFGVWGYLVPVGLFIVGIGLIVRPPRQDHGRLAVGIAIAFLGSLALFHLMTGTVSLARDIDLVRDRGGAVGSLIAFPLRRVVGFWGAFVILAAFTGLGVLVITKTTLRDVGLTLAAVGRRVSSWASQTTVSVSDARKTKKVLAAPRLSGPPKRTEKASRPTPKAPAKPKTDPVHAPPVVAPGGGYKLPPLDLLISGTPDAGHDRRALEETGRELEMTLGQHGVQARLVRIVPGPTVTRYEIELAPGVKVSRVTSLSHDIAYALAAAEVRVLAPIPGKSAVGVEVPNRHRRMIHLADVLRSDEAAAAIHPLQVGLGMDIAGTANLLNLADLPHVLIAGATGAGKSSCINAIVTSLLMRTSPEEVRLILVDPKRVELGQYNDVPHLMTRVITNPKKAADALQWTVGEMERRYELVADAGVRDIVGYREKFDADMLEDDRFDRFPYLVVVVDELNDLMMVAGRAVEDAVVRIAQMARAVGIHLVLATQRPSVDVITGVIKANIPSRLAFSVASQADSRVIIDQGGAEKLIGLGDMLVVTAVNPKPERIQGAWVSEEEIHAVVDWVKEQRKTQYNDEAVFQVAEKKAQDHEEFDGEDPVVIREAIEVIVRSQLGSTSMLQRKLRIGFARAGRVMDILERRGIVGPGQGSKAREVLLTVEELDEMLEGAEN
ncbi:MAG: DNA translocase FtsK, partial [Acidimicrobiia bacterium]|nr:DNA translocase FtsK [Acidimicrobiia bacterium]